MRYANQDFIRGNPREQLRTLAIAGIASIVVSALVVFVAVIVHSKATEPSGTRFSVVVPTLGPGVKSGSKVLLRGASVGEVTEVTGMVTGEVELDMVVSDNDIGVLTDSFDVDFRPENYFGITAVYLTSRSGGSAIREGQRISRVQAPDYTMSTMLESGSLVIDGTLTDDVIGSLDEIMRYANGLAPLIRSGMIVADTVAKTQQQLPDVHLRRMNSVLAEFPAFSRGAGTALDVIAHSVYNDAGAGEPISANSDLLDSTDETLGLLGSDLFGAAGTLLASHGEELTPLTQVVGQVSDPVGDMIGGPRTVSDIAELIGRLDGVFTGGPQDKVLQVRLMLDGFPAMARPMAAIGLSAPTPSRGN